ncbi:hypothetical protein [Alkalicoccobacillus murimartini]|uniref:Lipoprotein n=1 Tax=Alkalicoccobacillus murimartini TaxID=171685 RepID=A0ABT9YIF7_9BACI|nr:hypothetical protein [Alkalicoccobacillus murimartini]MDQ0207634.1 hypothetical protein [Alkalicoccobacillus murimartini]
MSKIIKTLIGIIGLFLIVSACQEDPNPSKTKPSGMNPNIYPPILNVVIDGETIGTTSGSYCWNQEVSRNHEVTECADMEDPVVIEKEKEGEPPSFSSGSIVELEFSESDWPTSLHVTVQTSTNENEQDITLADQTFNLPEESDDYIYRVTADWEQGDTSHAFMIKVE